MDGTALFHRMGCLIAGQAGEEPLGDQVSGQDQQGEDEHLVEAVHVLLVKEEDQKGYIQQKKMQR